VRCPVPRDGDPLAHKSSRGRAFSTRKPGCRFHAGPVASVVGTGLSLSPAEATATLRPLLGVLLVQGRSRRSTRRDAPFRARGVAPLGLRDCAFRERKRPVLASATTRRAATASATTRRHVLLSGRAAGSRCVSDPGYLDRVIVTHPAQTWLGFTYHDL